MSMSCGDVSVMGWVTEMRFVSSIVVWEERAGEKWWREVGGGLGHGICEGGHGIRVGGVKSGSFPDSGIVWAKKSGQTIKVSR